ncbi:MAG: radical SAM protein [Geitlerinemataceae cyanobacterium]
MGREIFEGYTDDKATEDGAANGAAVRVRERLAGANIYAKAARSILNPASGYIQAYDFTLNPYRGCQYGCSYCYATAFSPNAKMRDDWGNWVIVKDNAATLLGKELARWYKGDRDRPPSIYMSTVTDPYQPIESRARLPRSLLEVMLDRPACEQPTLVVQTRSPMVWRDRDLLHRFERVRVNISIPTGSDAVRRDFEPRSPSVKARINTLKKLRYTAPFDSQLKLSATVTPFLPTFGAIDGERTDGEESDDLDRLARGLACADRVVFQPFHPSGGGRLSATTREAAIALRAKYADWYAREADYSRCLRDKLRRYAPDLEILDGAEGFGYA